MSELKAYNVVVSNETENYINGETNLAFDAYDADDVDAILAEKDKEIAELKKKLMPCLNGDCILTCEVVEKYGKENAELKQKLDDAQAKVYADSIDAWKRERRLKRALWLARADKAIMVLDYSTLKCRWFKDYMKVEPPGCDVKMISKWANIERKCRAKAEEYK